MPKKPVTGRSPAANSAGVFDLPGMVWDHHRVGCDCRRCRRLRAAERRRDRKRIARDVTRDA